MVEYRDDWHAVSSVEKATGTSSTNGLSKNDVAKRQEQYGKNQITQKKAVNPVLIFLNQFNQPLIYILLAATIATYMMDHIVDSIVIFSVVLVNALIGFIQEYKALKAVHALSKSLQGKAIVIRDGKKQRIPVHELTIGDIVILEPGTKVPADLRLILNKELHVDESMLTGESVPVSKHIGTLPKDTVLGDRKNMAFFGTFVSSGRGTGIVVSIGDKTEMGRINEMISKADVLDTPLTIKINQFSKLLMYVILAFSAMTFVIGLLRGEDPFTMFLAAVALAVAAIPEGLPAAVTITLAIGVSRIARKNAIITKLPAVETLGSTQTIFSDKTGTLTKNMMTVQEIYTPDRKYKVEGTGYAPTGKIIGIPSKNLSEILLAGALCNDASLIKKQGQWQIDGDFTEGALLVSARKGGIDSEVVEKKYPRIDVIPFESEHKFMATLHRKGKTNVIYVKGAAEVVLKMCINSKKYHIHAEELAKEGLRVLAFASLETKKKTITPTDLKKMNFLGFQGMMDPPRDEVIDSIKNCHTAGISVKMITGDHVLTALAIAHKIGLTDKKNVISGKELQDISDSELEKIVLEVDVFARVSPKDKLRIVKAMQGHNHIIAVTGDGVNDAPSLKQANIGIAMGLNGTDVAKESSDMVLLDDNFSTIEAAVQEGRGVYDNLIKFITWTLPTNLGEGLIIFSAILIGGLLPILPLQLLWINMTTAIFLGMTLAFEPKEKGIMRRPPHDPNEQILSKWLILRIFITGIMICSFAYTLFLLAIKSGLSEEVARTIAVNMFVFGELFYLFSCRSLNRPVTKINFFSNKILRTGVLLMIGIQLLYTYSPFMNMLFGSAPISLMSWALIVSFSAIVMIVIELEKKIVNMDLAKQVISKAK